MVSVLEPINKYENDQPFEKWIIEFDDFVLANFGEDVSAKRKKAILMQLLGHEPKKFVESLAKEVQSEYVALVKELETRFDNKANETIERHIFNTMQQEVNESIDSFVIRLREQAKKCNYEVPSEKKTIKIGDAEHEIDVTYVDITDSLIRDRIVVGVSNESNKTRLLRDHNLTLKTAINMVRSQELADERVSTLQGMQVNAVNRGNVKNNTKSYHTSNMKPQYAYDRTNKMRNERTNQNFMRNVNNTDKRMCKFCGEYHKFSKPTVCPAFGSKCDKCG